MRLEKYLPDFISALTQFKEIDRTHTYELDKLDVKLKEVQDNQFIETANSSGLSRYENMLNIPTDRDMDVRRFNILSRFNASIPFSMRWLINMLNTTVGKGLYIVELFNEEYTIQVGIQKEKSYIIDKLKKDLRDKLPANLIINVYLLNSIESPIYNAVIVRTGDKQTL